MLKIKFHIPVVFMLFILSFCLSPTPGLIVTNTKQHVSGIGNSLGNGRIEKMGSSCIWGISPITALLYRPKDTNIAEAMDRGGITKIGVVDSKSFSLFAGIFYRECVEVWGE